MKKIILGSTMFASLILGTMVVSADEVEYEVQSGDTLSMIALMHQAEVDDIKEKNKIEDINLIFPGEKFKIDTELKPEEIVRPEVVEAYVPEYQEEYVEQQVVAQYEQPVQQEVAQPAYVANGSSAKEWIAMKESTNNYNATNGRYIGKYQLDASYLNGDYSPENQERVADAYVVGRYGSWEAAQQFWLANGWY